MSESTEGAAPVDKMVKESDLLAIKGSLEGKLTKAQAEIAGEQKKVTDQGAKIEQLEAELKLRGTDELERARKELLEARSKLAKDEQSYRDNQAELSKKLTDIKKAEVEAFRQSMIVKYKVDPTVLSALDDPKDIELAALRAAATASPKKAGLDVAGASTGGEADVSGFARVKRAFEQSEK